MSILDLTQAYTFSKIFELKINPKDLAKEFGYSFLRKYLDLPQYQLCTELIALDNWQKKVKNPYLIGAVTTGKIWEFAQLNRQEKHIDQGLESYRVPEDINSLMRILVQSLIIA